MEKNKSCKSCIKKNKEIEEILKKMTFNYFNIGYLTQDALRIKC
mgnify:CR=1 FL=1